VTPLIFSTSPLLLLLLLHYIKPSQAKSSHLVLLDFNNFHPTPSHFFFLPSLLTSPRSLSSLLYFYALSFSPLFPSSPVTHSPTPLYQPSPQILATLIAKSSVPYPSPHLKFTVAHELTSSRASPKNYYSRERKIARYLEGKTPRKKDGERSKRSVVRGMIEWLRERGRQERRREKKRKAERRREREERRDFLKI